MGVGHLYIGKKKRGIAIMLGGFALVVASLIVNFYYSYSILRALSDIVYSSGSSDFSLIEDEFMMPGPDPWLIMTVIIAITIIRWAFLIWQAYDAFKLAKKYNEELCETGQPPW